MPWIAITDVTPIQYALRVKVLECKGQTLTVGGVPEEFLPLQKDKWCIAGTDIKVLEYFGTFEMGMLYLDKPINIEIGKYINLKQ